MRRGRVPRSGAQRDRAGGRTLASEQTAEEAAAAEVDVDDVEQAAVPVAAAAEPDVDRRIEAAGQRDVRAEAGVGAGEAEPGDDACIDEAADVATRRRFAPRQAEREVRVGAGRQPAVIEARDEVRVEADIARVEAGAEIRAERSAAEIGGYAEIRRRLEADVGEAGVRVEAEVDGGAAEVEAGV